MDNTLLEILSEIKIINKKIDKLQQELIENKNVCKKMNDHIDFIEETYDSLKKPIDYIKDRFKYNLLK